MFQLWQLLAGLGVFIYAMTLLEQGLRGLSTRPLRNLLRHHTHSPLEGVIVGTLSTAILQSSSLVGLFVLAFVGSGILPLRNALGIVFGANLGTTLTGWLITAIGFKLNVNGYALTLIALGSLSYVTFQPRSRHHHQSAVIFALGLLLLGLTWMKDSMSFLSTQVDPLIFQDYPLVIYFIGGMIFTALVQSSSATMVIILSALHADIIPLSSAAAIAIGADLGTTSTVLLGSIKSSSNAKRVALSHFLFNLGTDILALTLLTPLLTFITLSLSVKDTMYALVGFHSLFNLMGVVLFLPFTKHFALWLEQRFQEPIILGCRHIKLVPPGVPEAAICAIEQDTRDLIMKALLINLRVLKTSSGALLENEQARALYQNIKNQRLSFNEQYADIKVHEEQLQSYRHKLPEQDINDCERQELSTLLEAARNAAYSAKSLKDIRANLIDLRQQADAAQLLRQIDSDIVTIYQAMMALLEPAESSANDDAIGNIKTTIFRSHDHLHEEMLRYSLRHDSEIRLPTLFNINREIYVSNTNLLNAVLTLSTYQNSANDEQRN